MNNQTTIKVLTYGIFILLLFISFGFIQGFYTGAHNIDLGMNINLINAKYGLNLVDINSEREVWTGTEMYIHGNEQTRYSFFGFGITLLFIGIMIGYLWRKS